MAFNIKDRVAKAAQTKDHATASSGGDYAPHEKGRPNLRFVGYYELGLHEETHGKAKGKVQPKVSLVFELSGPKWQPREVDGVKVPLTMKLDLNLSTNEKAWFYKIFKAMNAAHGNKYKYMPEMLGLEFRGEIEHSEPKGDNKRVYANLKYDSISKAQKYDDDKGEYVAVTVDPPLSPLKGFIWDDACPEMWDDIFIPGEYPERKNDAGEVTHPAKSKNYWQLLIASAKNFKGCPIYDYAEGKIDKAALAAMQDTLGTGDEDSVPDTGGDQSTPERADPLAGVA